MHPRHFHARIEYMDFVHYAIAYHTPIPRYMHCRQKTAILINFLYDAAPFAALQPTILPPALESNIRKKNCSEKKTHPNNTNPLHEHLSSDR